jgi:hypothetical protein
MVFIFGSSKFSTKLVHAKQCRLILNQILVFKSLIVAITNTI